MKFFQKNKMNFSKFKLTFSSDDDGTFWPGVIEVPNESEIHYEEDNKNKFIKNNPRVVTGLILFIVLSLFFVSKLTAFLLFIFFRMACQITWKKRMYRNMNRH